MQFLIDCASFALKKRYKFEFKDISYIINQNSMKPYTQSKDQFEQNQHTIRAENQTQLSKTPRKNRPERREETELLSFQLSPLVPAARLSFSSLVPIQQCRLQFVQTPLFNRTNIISQYIDQDSHQFKSPLTIETKVLFQTEEVDQSDCRQFSNQNSISEQQNQEDENPENQDSREFQGENNNGKNNIFGIDLRRQANTDLQDADSKNSNSNRSPCNCKRTQCLKLYCDCFREGLTCGLNCQCIGCHNTLEYEPERLLVKQSLNKRNPEAFKPKIEGQQHSKGCNCKKTGCMKKYCECFQAGLICGDQCKCQQCKNISTSAQDQYYKEQKYKMTVKKQRRMKQLV